MKGTIENRTGADVRPGPAAPAFAFESREGATASHDAHSGAAIDPARVLVICNPRSHRNKRTGSLPLPDGIVMEAPPTRGELADLLSRRAAAGLDLVVIAGGDGTVRDTLSCGGDLWRSAGAPAVAFLPRGKTNALALDLGVPDDWQVADAVAAWCNGTRTMRAPIEVTREDVPADPVRGFLFGAGIFVDATDLAQTTHKWGAFNNLAVGLSLGWVMLKVLFGSDTSRWRTGYRMTVNFEDDARAMGGAMPPREGNRFLALVSTMENMPFGLKPLGPRRAGMKALTMAAPPRRFLRTLSKLARGSNHPKLAARGIHRIDAAAIAIDLEGGFVFDGERFDAGRYALREGRQIAFVTP